MRVVCSNHALVPSLRYAVHNCQMHMGDNWKPTGNPANPSHSHGAYLARAMTGKLASILMALLWLWLWLWLWLLTLMLTLMLTLKLLLFFVVLVVERTCCITKSHH